MRRTDAMLVCGCCAEAYARGTEHACSTPPACRTQIERPDSPDTVMNFEAFDLAARVESDGLREDTACFCSDMRYGRGFDEPDMDMVKQGTKRIVASVVESIPNRLRPLLREGVTDDEVFERLQINPFDGLQTAAQEMNHASKNVPVLKTRIVQATAKHKIVSFRFADLLIRKLQHDKHFRRRCDKKSEQWKKGDKYRVAPTGRR